MSDLLFEINENKPEWKIAKSQHGIETRQVFEDGILVAFAAWIPGRQCETTTDETERGAVVSLIHILKLDGWQRISMNR